MNDNVHRDAMFTWGLNRFKNAKIKHEKNHPIITGIKGKFDTKYCDWMSKWYKGSPGDYSVNCYNKVPAKDKYLFYWTTKCNSIIAAMKRKKTRMDTLLTIWNMSLEKTMGWTRVHVGSPTGKPMRRDYIKAKLVSALKWIAQIKPEDAAVKMMSGRQCTLPLRPMIYSTFIANVFHFTQLYLGELLGIDKNIMKFYIGIIGFGRLFRYTFRSKNNTDNMGRDDTVANDIIKHPERFHKIFDIYTHEDDWRYWDYLKTNQTTQIALSKAENAKKMIRNFAALTLSSAVGMFALWNRMELKIVLTRSMFSYIVSNEIVKTGILVNDWLEAKSRKYDKIKFFKDNLTWAYIKKDSI